MQAELGGADILINNAGIMLLGPFSAEQRDDYRQMIEVNLMGAITTTEVFLPQLRATDAGNIINISSLAGRTARAGNGVYAATKWGINGWSESLRQELLPRVRVTLIEPGVVDTELPTTPHTSRPKPRSTSYMREQRSPQATSPKSSPSLSRVPGTSPSTRSSSARLTRHSERPARD